MAPKSAVPIANLSDGVKTLVLNDRTWIGQSLEGLPMIPAEGEVRIRIGLARVTTSREDIDDGFFEYPKSVRHKNLIKGLVLANDDVELDASLGSEHDDAVSLLRQFVRKMHLRSTVFVINFPRPSAKRNTRIEGTIYVFRVSDFRPTRPRMFLYCPMTKTERHDIDCRISFDKMTTYRKRMLAQFQVRIDGIHLQLDMETDEDGVWGEFTDLDMINIMNTATYLGLMLLQDPLNFDLSSSTPPEERRERFLNVGVDIYVHFGTDSSHWKSFLSFAKAVGLKKALEERVQSVESYVES